MQTIHHSHQLALELTKFLGMIQPANPENLSIDINNSLITIGSHENEVSISYTYNETDPSSNRHNIQDIQENDDDISSSINIASREIGRNSNNLDDDIDSSPINIFQSGQMQLNIIDEFSDSLSVLNNGDSGKY
jgi:hypothetical protein